LTDILFFYSWEITNRRLLVVKNYL